MIVNISIQLVDYHTRNHIGTEFKVAYRLQKDDEVYYGRDRKGEFDDTVWTVMRCRTEQDNTNKQIVFVIPSSRNASEALAKRNAKYKSL